MVKRLLLIAILCMMMVTACENDSQSTNKPNQTTNAYPAPDEVVYPASNQTQTTNAYPAPAQTTEEEGRRVMFDEGIVKVGQSEAKGTGPADLAIRIVSVSYAGEVLGSGAIGSDGHFTIPLSRPIEEREVVAIQFGDPSLQDRYSDLIGSDMPMIGFLLDQQLAE